MEEGIVPGGGVALLRCSPALDNLEVSNKYVLCKIMEDYFTNDIVGLINPIKCCNVFLISEMNKLELILFEKSYEFHAPPSALTLAWKVNSSLRNFCKLKMIMVMMQEKTSKSYYFF